MTVLEFILPALVVILLSLPLIKVFTGKVSVKALKKIKISNSCCWICYRAVCLAIYLAVTQRCIR